MAAINMCDRCGAIGLADALATIVHHASPHARTYPGEYCPTCYGSFLEWRNAVTPEIKGTAFREPYSPESKEIGE